MTAHHQTQHVGAKGGPGQEDDREDGGEKPRTQRIAFL